MEIDIAEEGYEPNTFLRISVEEIRLSKKSSQTLSENIKNAAEKGIGSLKSLVKKHDRLDLVVEVVVNDGTGQKTKPAVHEKDGVYNWKKQVPSAHEVDAPVKSFEHSISFVVLMETSKGSTGYGQSSITVQGSEPVRAELPIYCIETNEEKGKLEVVVEDNEEVKRRYLNEKEQQRKRIDAELEAKAKGSATVESMLGESLEQQKQASGPGKGDHEMPAVISMDDVEEASGGTRGSKLANIMSEQWRIDTMNTSAAADSVAKLLSFPLLNSATQLPSFDDLGVALGMEDSVIARLKGDSLFGDREALVAYQDVAQRLSNANSHPFYRREEFKSEKQFEEWLQRELQDAASSLQQILTKQFIPGQLKFVLIGLENIPENKPGSFQASVRIGHGGIVKDTEVVKRKQAVWNNDFEHNVKNADLEIQIDVRHKRGPMIPWHPLGSVTLRLDDVIGNTSPAEKVFNLAQPGKDESRGCIRLKIHYKIDSGSMGLGVSHMPSEVNVFDLASDVVKFGALESLDKVGEESGVYTGISDKWLNLLDEFWARYGVGRTWIRLQQLGVAVAVSEYALVDATLLDSLLQELLDLEQAQDTQLTLTEINQIGDMKSMVWKGIYCAFDQYWRIRDSQTLKAMVRLIETVAFDDIVSSNSKVNSIADYDKVVHISNILKDSARRNFIRLQNSLGYGDVDMGRLAMLMTKCADEIKQDLSGFEAVGFASWGKTTSCVYWDDLIAMLQSKIQASPAQNKSLSTAAGNSTELTGSGMISDALFSVHQSLEYLFDILQENKVPGIQKPNFDNDFKSLMLQWVDWRMDQLKSLVDNAVLNDAKGGWQRQDLLGVSTSALDVPSLINVFLDTLKSSPLAEQFNAEIAGAFCEISLHYCRKVKESVVEDLQAGLSRMWGSNDDDIHEALARNDCTALEQCIQSHRENNNEMIADWCCKHGNAIHLAVHYEFSDCIALLVKEGVDINAKELESQMTPLHMLCKKASLRQKQDGREDSLRYLSFIDVLLDNGAKADVVDGTGRLPSKVLKTNSDTNETVMLIKSKLDSRVGNQDHGKEEETVMDVTILTRFNNVVKIKDEMPLQLERFAESANMGPDMVMSGLLSESFEARVKSLVQGCRAELTSIMTICGQAIVSKILRPRIDALVPEAGNSLAGIGSSLNLGSAASENKASAAGESLESRKGELTTCLMDQLTGAIEELSVNGRLVREFLLPCMWNCILDEIETLVFPEMHDSSRNVLSVQQARVLSNLLDPSAGFQSVFYVRDGDNDPVLDARGKPIGLNERFFQKHAHTQKLKTLIALYSVPVRKLQDMYNKLKQQPSLKTAWQVDPSDIFKLFISLSRINPNADQFVKGLGKEKTKLLVLSSFKLPESEEIFGEDGFPCYIKEGSLNKVTGTAYITTNHVLFKSSMRFHKGKNFSISLIDIVSYSFKDRENARSIIIFWSIPWLQSASNAGAAANRCKLVFKDGDVMKKFGQNLFHAAAEGGNRRIRRIIANQGKFAHLASMFGVKKEEELISSHQRVTYAPSIDGHMFNGTLHLFKSKVGFEKKPLGKPVFELVSAMQSVEMIQQAGSAMPIKITFRNNSQWFVRTSDPEKTAILHKQLSALQQSEQNRDDVLRVMFENVAGQTSKMFKVDDDTTVGDICTMTRDKYAIHPDAKVQLRVEGGDVNSGAGFNYTLRSNELITQVREHVKTMDPTNTASWNLSVETDQSHCLIKFNTPITLKSEAAGNSVFLLSQEAHKNAYARKDTGSRWVIINANAGNGFSQEEDGNATVKFGDTVNIIPEVHQTDLKRCLHVPQRHKIGKVRVDRPLSSDETIVNKFELEAMSAASKRGTKIKFGDEIRLKQVIEFGSMQYKDLYVGVKVNDKHPGMDGMTYRLSSHALGIQKVCFQWQICDADNHIPQDDLRMRVTSVVRPSIGDLDGFRSEDASGEALQKNENLLGEFLCMLRAGFAPHLRGRYCSLRVYQNEIHISRQADSPAAAIDFHIPSSQISSVQATVAFYVPDSLEIIANDSRFELCAFKSAAKRDDAVDIIRAALEQ